MESVTLDLSTLLSTTLTVQNDATSGSAGTAKTEVQITLQGPGNQIPGQPLFDTLSPGFACNLSSGQETTSGLLTKNAAADNTYTQAAILALFSGRGNVSLDASTFTDPVLANTGGNTTATQQTDSSLTGTVSYDYIPREVPEPGAIISISESLLLVPFFLSMMRRKAGFSV